MKVKNILFNSFVLFLLVTTFSISFVGPARCNTSYPFIDLRVEIDPENHALVARALWKHLPVADEYQLYLNKILRIDSVKADGRPATYIFDVKGDGAPYSSIARALKVKGQGRELEIFYSGYLPDTVAAVNLITSELVELALYSAYYPMNLREIPLFEFRLEVTLPKNFEVVTSGEQKELVSWDGGIRRVIFSTAAGMDIPIVASPALIRQTGESGGMEVEVYSSAAGKALAAWKITPLTRAMASFERRFGKTSSSGKLHFVLSPRDGWGYSRLPLAVVSEKRELNSSGQPFASESSLHGAVHETAHFWWLIAPTTQIDDWINEGLSEYSAFSFMAAEFGSSYRDYALNKYLSDIRKATTQSSIMETGIDSPDSYVNRYEKPALLLYTLGQRAGNAVLDGFLFELYARFKETRDATKHAFLDLARKHFKTEDYEFFKSYLDLSGWSEQHLKALAETGNFTGLL